MWIVLLALRRPYTFIVMALLILILGVVAIRNTATDIFPKIDIPVVSIIWQYSGLPPAQFEKYITTFSEYTVSSGVNDVQRIESQTVNGAAIIKVFFQQNVNIGNAMAQATAMSQTILRRLPPGSVPPLIVQYDAASVPVIQLLLASNKLSEAQLYDFGIYRRAPGDRAGEGRAPAAALRRQAAPDHGGPRSAIPAGQGHHAHGREQRAGRRQFELAHGQRQDRRQGLHRRAEQQPGEHRGAQRRADQGSERHAPSTCATWPTCATASASRPTWSAATGAAGRC